jgi:Uma2 family endonuclease
MGNGLSLSDPAVQAALLHQHLLSVDDYHRMIAAGIFDEDDRLELLEGVIVEMSPQRPRHARIIRRLCDPQFVAAGPSFVVQAQLPLTLGPDSEPEPDVAVVAKLEAEEADRRDGHPATAALVIEVSGESLQKDRIAKGAVYTGAGIPEYVIVNLDQECLEVHRDPDAATRRYRSVSTLSGLDRFQSATVPGFAFAVGHLLA